MTRPSFALLLLLAALGTACGPTQPDTEPPDGGDTPGKPDGSTPTQGVCGDGALGEGEACDDGNVRADDGCSSTCTQEPGWTCTTPGKACTPVPVCGDGRVEGAERCDDRNTTSGDGCSGSCTEEPGWTCAVPGARCRAAACGDSLVVDDEECEDGNAVSGDGCSATCRLEPGYKCETPGAPCAPTDCGDGVPEGTEQCDDGNSNLGDGCSPLCMQEPDCTNGTCTEVCGDGLMLPNGTEACDDGNRRSNDGCSADCTLEPGFQCTTVEQAPPAALDIPVVYRDFRGYDLVASGDLPRGHIDFENANNAEAGIVAALLGADGKPVYAKEGVSSATTHGKAAFDQWYRDTEGVNLTHVSTLHLTRKDNGSYEFDDQTFFPLDALGWVAEGKEPLRNASDGNKRNFSFTSETRYWFEYKGSEVLSFRGDDDVWVFINGHLAVDLGGVHGAKDGSVTLSQHATEFGLRVGGIYEAAVFQAERHTSASSYKLTLTDFVTRRTECATTCGDGIQQESEQCDDGVNDGGYGQCAPGCVLGERCGDGKRQAGETCDDGNTASGDGCSATCSVEIE